MRAKSKAESFPDSSGVPILVFCEVYPMGLFSKIFGSDQEGQGEAPDGDATATSDAAAEHARRNAGTGHTAVERSSARATAGVDPSAAPRTPNTSAAVAKAESSAGGAARGAPDVERSLARAGARPSVSANIEAKVHTQAAGSPAGIARKAAEVVPNMQSVGERPAPKRAGDVTPSPPPAQVGPPPKPGARSRGPVPAAGKVPAAKKVTMTATLPLGGSPPAPPKPPPEDGAGNARAAEALVLEPLAGSARPPAPTAQETDDVDRAFERIAPIATAPRPVPGMLADDQAVKIENARLFSAMVTDHARPLRELMLDLTIGPTTKQWLEVARPAAQSILKGALALEQGDLSLALGEVVTALTRTGESAGVKIAGADRDAILSAYGRLTALLPSAFELKSDRDRREPLVVHHLLLQIPGVHKVTLDKLYAANLASLEALCRSSADDLVQIARVERECADSIIRRFQTYWRDRAERPLRRDEDGAKHRLRELVEQLGRAHAQFQHAEANEDRDAKRRARSDRRTSALAMNVLLAQLGEVDLVEELERSPTERRISRVRSYIEGSATSTPA